VHKQDDALTMSQFSDSTILAPPLSRRSAGEAKREVKSAQGGGGGGKLYLSTGGEAQKK
jgi:hypothetical protein